MAAGPAPTATLTKPAAILATSTCNQLGCRSSPNASVTSQTTVPTLSTTVTNQAAVSALSATVLNNAVVLVHSAIVINRTTVSIPSAIVTSLGSLHSKLKTNLLSSLSDRIELRTFYLKNSGLF